MIGIKIARIRAGLSQTELAKRINVGSQVISRYERNAVTPRIEVLKAIANELGVLIDDLVNDEGGKKK